MYSCILVSCKPVHDQHEIESAMNQYDHLILKLDVDSIALMYTQDGKMGNEAQGRDGIRKFLAAFNQVKVLSQKSTTASIEIHDQEAVQKGSYNQTVILNPGDTMNIHGDFESHWIWIVREGWQIEKMETYPAQ